MRLRYEVACPGCGAEWDDIEHEDAELASGEARAVATCRECFSVSAVTFRMTAGEVGRDRRDVLRTLQKMYQSFMKAKTRLETRRGLLADQARRGDERAREALRPLERRIEALRPPETGHLDWRARDLAEAERSAPERAEEHPCPRCGAGTELFRETHRGFEVPCPRCGTPLRIRLRRESGSSDPAGDHASP
jgi:hypothetical protein